VASELVLHAYIPREVRDEVEALQQRAERGEAEAFGKRGEIMDAHPVMWQGAGDLAAHVERSWLTRCAGGNTFAAAAFGRQAEAMRRELAGDNPTPLEQLLVARIVACWLQVQYADWRSAESARTGGSHVEGEYLAKRQDRASMRYLQAIRTLAQVRRLALPAVQINVADKQINVAG
jgi:hypothetical protein